MSNDLLTFDGLVELAERIRNAPPVTVTREELDALQRAHVRVCEERRGVTPGGIEWRG